MPQQLIEMPKLADITVNARHLTDDDLRKLERYARGLRNVIRMENIKRKQESQEVMF